MEKLLNKLLKYPLFKWGLDRYQKYKEVILYIFFGGLTTLVNFAVYIFLNRFLNVYILTSNTFAFIAAVLFAYFTNKVFVFHSHNWTFKVLFLEMVAFFSARLFSFAVDTGIMYVFADRLAINDILVKIGANVIVVILNYLFSKYYIFRNKNTEGKMQ